ncbi:MAG: alpha/beta hydrolase-fold protein [Gemmatimonas sp.]
MPIEQSPLASVRLIFSALVTMSCVAAPMFAQDAAAPPVPIPVHDSFTVVSKALGEPRRINVYTPASYKNGQTRFPVLYMPDGGLDEDFPHIVRTVDSLVQAHAIRPVIVVGIPNTVRRRDLTGPTRVKSDSAIAPVVGGSAQFRAFVKDELFAEIQKRYRTTSERSIVGESLAGLFIVETFLRQPDMFTHYVALDPSTWWNAGALIDSAPNLIKAFNTTPRTLYLAISDIKEMGEGVIRLDKLLRASPPKGLSWSFRERLDLVHSTIFSALEGPALASSLR